MYNFYRWFPTTMLRSSVMTRVKALNRQWRWMLVELLCKEGGEANASSLGVVYSMLHI
jgi:hypothetical protein